MKHPALTRVLAIVLVLLCLTMAAAGALGLTRAGKDRRSTLEEMQRLRARIEEYETVSAELADTQSYEERSASLDERQKSHSSSSAEHRSELSTFTLTQYGLGVGTEAIDEADRQFAQFKALFERAMPAFESGMGQADALLANLNTLAQTLAPILSRADEHLAAAQSVTDALENGTVTYAQVAAAYDGVLAMADESAALLDTLRELEPTLDAIAAFDPSALTALADGMGDIPASLGSFGGVPLEGYTEKGVDVPYDLNQLAQMKESYDQVWGLMKQSLALLDELGPEARTQWEQTTGVSLDELHAAAQAAHDALAAHGDEPLDPAASETILAAYRANRNAIRSALEQAEAGLGQAKGYAAQIREGIDGVQKQIDALKQLVAKAREGIALGEDALYQARAMIWLQMGKQREKEAELRQRKAELDQESEELQQSVVEADDQKDLEQRQRLLRLTLTSREEIQSRVDAGEEPAAAARAFAEESESAAQQSYGSRRLACLLMLFGALYGVIGIPAAFEATKSRLMLILPVLHCLGCAAGAVQILWRLGRGLSYSCLAVMAFALLQLLVSRPKKKTKRRRAARA